MSDSPHPIPTATASRAFKPNLEAVIEHLSPKEIELLVGLRREKLRGEGETPPDGTIAAPTRERALVMLREGCTQSDQGEWAPTAGFPTKGELQLLLLRTRYGKSADRMATVRGRSASSPELIEPALR